MRFSLRAKMSFLEFFDNVADNGPSLPESGRVEEQEVLMIQSFQAESPFPERASYAFSGVVLSAMLENIGRGDRFNGRFECALDMSDSDGTDAATLDDSGYMSLNLGPYCLQNVAPLRIQRLVTPKFFRIAIRCDRMSGADDDIGRFNLAFYSDPRFCEGKDFQVGSLDISNIPMPSLYIESPGGAPLVSAKLQTLVSD